MKYFIASVALILFGACNPPKTEKYTILLKPSSSDAQQIQAATAILSKRLETAYEDNAVARVKGDQIEIEVYEKLALKELLPLLLTRGRFTLQETFSNEEIGMSFFKVDPGVANSTLLQIRASGQGAMVGEASIADTAAIVQSQLFPELKKQHHDMELLWGRETMQWTVELYAVKKTENPISNSAVESVLVDLDEVGREAVSVALKEEFHERWLNMTRANISRSIAICLDNRVLSAPMVVSEIPGGKLMISGGQGCHARMIAAIVGSDVLPITLSVASIDPALEASANLSHPTAEQIQRYNSLQKEFLLLRHQIDSVIAQGPSNANTTTVRREFGRIYYQDLPTVVAETKMSEGQVDMFLEKADVVLSTFKALLDPEGAAAASDSFMDSLSLSQ